MVGLYVLAAMLLLGVVGLYLCLGQVRKIVEDQLRYARLLSAGEKKVAGRPPTIQGSQMRVVVGMELPTGEKEGP